MDDANLSAYKEMLGVNKFVLDTKLFTYRLNIAHNLLIRYYLLDSCIKVCHSPPRSYLAWGFIYMERFGRYSPSQIQFLFENKLFHSCTPFVTGYGPVRGVDNSRRIPGVSNNTWSPTLRSL